MEGFNRERFRELFEAMSFSSIEEIVEAVESDGVISEEFDRQARREALTTAIRQELRRRDPETGEPLGVSIIGEDGKPRYMSPKLFDDGHYRQVINDRYKRLANLARDLRYWEHKAGIPASEQLSLDFSWIDTEEEAA